MTARILIVDDETFVRRVLVRTLKGYDVEEASNGRDALNRLESSAPYDLVLCDLMMPGVTGMELYRRVQQRIPGQEASFIFLTGGVFTDHAEAFLSEIPNTVLYKPFDSNELLSLIARMTAPEAAPPPDGRPR